MKNAIIIHGYNGVPKVLKWLKEELEAKGYKVIMPEFPPKEGVIYEDWCKILDEFKSEINEESIIIAHSIGNEFIIRYLENYYTKIKLYISLAGFNKYFECEGKDDLNRACKDFLVSDKQIEHFKALVSSGYAIYSNNDHIVPFEVLEDYPKTLNLNPFYIKDIGHMGSKCGIEKIPEILDIISKEG